MARLIIVEDNVELASLIVAAATSRGHEAEAAHDGQDALARLQAERFDLAVVDLLLPDISGTEILDALQGTATRSIVMSGLLRDPAAAQKVREVHGAAAVFVKPFELRDLLDAFDSLSGTTSPAPSPAVDDFSELDAVPAPTEGMAASDDFEMPFGRRDRVWGREREDASGDALPAWTREGPIQPG